MKIVLYFLLSMPVITSCFQPSNNLKAATIAETKLNVSYGPDSAQRMDIYLPAGRLVNSTKVIILIHGGGWNGGSRHSFADYIDSFKKRIPDYAIFNIDYRLATYNHIFPTQENDVKTAIDFIANNAGTYQVNKDKLVLLGASAGAHLALLQAYKYNDPKVKTVIDFFGPTDLTAMYNHPWHPMIPLLLKTLTGTTPDADSEVYKNSSPANFVSPQSPPTLILYGGKDYVVDTSQSAILENKLREAGVPTKTVVYPKEGHGWHNASLSDSFDHIVSFLREYV